MEVAVITVDSETIKSILTALSLYLKALNDVPRKSPTIESETRKVTATIGILYDDGDETKGLIDVRLDKELWQIIRGVCGRYAEAKESKLTTIRRTELVQGSTELEEKELQQLKNFLHAPDVVKLGLKEPLVSSFHRLLPSDNNAADMMSVQVQVGDIYGGQLMVGGTVSGSQQQNNFSDLGEQLSKLAEKLLDEKVDLDPELRGNSLGDVQTIQSQLTKPQPDKKIVVGAVKKLRVLADTAQVGQAAAVLAPHIHKIVHLIGSIWPS